MWSGKISCPKCGKRLGVDSIRKYKSGKIELTGNARAAI